MHIKTILPVVIILFAHSLLPAFASSWNRNDELTKKVANLKKSELIDSIQESRLKKELSRIRRVKAGLKSHNVREFTPEDKDILKLEYSKFDKLVDKLLSETNQKFTGSYKSEKGELYIVARNGGRVDFVVFQRCGGIRGDHVAMCQGKAIRKGNDVDFAGDEVKLKISFCGRSATVEVLESGPNSFGAQSTVGGVYRKISSAKPNLEKVADSHEMDTSLWKNVDSGKKEENIAPSE